MSVGHCLRLLRTPAEMQETLALQQEIWQSPAAEVMPVHALLAASKNGGQVLGALVNGALVGMTVGIAAWGHGKRYLLSHMAGVHPRYQGSGIGTALKLKQRELARADGYSSIRWTFDPLQRGNANFNFRLPGVWSGRYFVDYYGEMEDGINAGLPSDRLEAHWPVSGRPRRTGKTLKSAEQLLLLESRDGSPNSGNLSDCEDVTGIEIPASLTALKQQDPSLALEWRLAVRDSFVAAFDRGYRAVAFTFVDDRPVYVLAAPKPWFLYVLQCSDKSLYTGITVNVERRLRQHQAGKGASYTATRRPLRLLANWRYAEQGTARRAEAAFKKLARTAKIAQIESASTWQDGMRQPL